MTTVGYGDFYPVTLLGRIIAGILMTVGIGFFGTFTAYVASFFVGDKAIPPADEEILAKLVYIEKTLSMIQSEQEKISRGE